MLLLKIISFHYKKAKDLNLAVFEILRQLQSETAYLQADQKLMIRQLNKLFLDKVFIKLNQLLDVASLLSSASNVFRIWQQLAIWV